MSILLQKIKRYNKMMDDIKAMEKKDYDEDVYSGSGSESSGYDDYYQDYQDA